MNEIQTELTKIFSRLLLADIDTRVNVTNMIKKELLKISPFKDPVDCVQWIKAEKVEANEYNPNSVAPPEMKLLKHSIIMDGYTQPIVAIQDQNKYIVVDGFHRLRCGKEDKEINQRIHGYLPLVIINKEIKDRMASTIRHNRARGKHGVKPMSDIIGNLIQLGWDDARIATELGMEADEVLRLKQRVGLPGIFKDQDFSKAWVESKLFAPLKELQSIDPRKLAPVGDEDDDDE
jgi:ParB-like chromosome segregation protein Spo0J